MKGNARAMRPILSTAGRHVPPAQGLQMEVRSVRAANVASAATPGTVRMAASAQATRRIQLTAAPPVPPVQEPRTDLLHVHPDNAASVAMRDTRNAVTSA